MIKGMKRTSAWKATPRVQAPAVRATLPLSQKPTGWLRALPNRRMKTRKPRQLIRLAPTELQAYAVNRPLAARI